MIKWMQEHSTFHVVWVGIHVLCVGLTLGMGIFVLCSFGYGPGFNPPLDIHFPSSDEIYEEFESLEPVELPIPVENEDGEYELSPMT